ncbi:MAG: hypothetical protein KAY37_05385 [Phycisphaerae bacterium]|nr:hypothetical protein [Phycisphaerae bacterium]
MMRYDRLRTPPEHLGVLVEPPAPRLHATLRGRSDTSFENVPILDTSVAALRAELRRRLDLNGPVILTGHQAEFIHAGVFAKTIAAHTLAGRFGGQAAFLTVDGDLPKATQLILPQTTSCGLRRIEVAIPGCDPRCPYELQPPTPGIP